MPRGFPHRPRLEGAVSWTLFAAVVGAGFASGQELVPFLDRCGAAAPAAVAAACLLTGLLACWRAAPQVARPAGPPVAVWAGRSIAWISLVAMLAALAHLLEARLPPPAALGLAAAVVGGASLVPAARGLGRLSVTLGPCMALLVAATAAGAQLSGVPPASSVPAPLLPPAPAACAGRVGLYAAANGLFAEGAVAAVIRSSRDGPAAWSRTRAVTAGAQGGALLGLVAGLAVHGLSLATPRGPAMPLLELAQRLHPALGHLYTATIAAAAYTTAVAAAVGLSGSARSRRAAGLWWTVSALPLAALGFAPAVLRLYPLAGWLALASLAAEAVFAAAARRGLY